MVKTLRVAADTKGSVIKTLAKILSLILSALFILELLYGKTENSPNAFLPDILTSNEWLGVIAIVKALIDYVPSLA